MERRDKIFAAILAAVPQELRDLPTQLTQPESFEFLGEQLHLGTFGKHRLLIGTTGLGKVNAAAVTAALLTRFGIEQVWNIGCAGAYPEGPLRIGDVLVSEQIVFGDEGVLTEHEVLSSRAIGIPLLRAEAREIYEAIPLTGRDLFCWTQARTPAGRYRLVAQTSAGRAEFVGTSAPGVAAIKTADTCTGDCAAAKSPHPSSASPPGWPECFQLLYGSSLTVSMASGDAATAGQRFRRYGAVAENMEGSGVAQACWRFAVPMLECRGISNMAGDRCKANWQFSKALAHCHAIVMQWLTELAAAPSATPNRTRDAGFEDRQPGNLSEV